jgi:hypothetical protein
MIQQLGLEAASVGPEHEAETDGFAARLALDVLPLDAKLEP